MPNSKNITQVESIITNLRGAKAVYLVDHQGLTANQMNQLRHLIDATEANLQIVKNTLFLRALREVQPDINTESFELSGTTAALYANQDPVAPVKVIVKFTKDHQLPTIKLGLLDHRVLTADQVDQLSKLPGIDVLRGQVVGMLASPLSRLVGSLNSTLSKIVLVLDQIRLQKSN